MAQKWQHRVQEKKGRDSMALPSPSARTGSFSSTSGIMGSKGSKGLFAISVENSWQRHRGAWASQIPAPEPSEVWDSFYPRSEMAQEFIGSWFGFLSFFFSFYWTPGLLLMQRRPEPGTEREGKSLSSLSRQVCEQHQHWVYFLHGFQSVKKYIFALFCVREIFQSRIPAGMATGTGPCGHSVLSRQDLGSWQWENPEVLWTSALQPLLSSHSALARLLLQL